MLINDILDLSMIEATGANPERTFPAQ